MMKQLGDSFNGVSEQYARARATYPRELIQYIADAASLDSESDVLDIGCGSGQATLDFASLNSHIVALDPAQNALNLLKLQCSDRTNIELVNAKFEEYKAPNSSFDLILCAQAFHWLDPESAAIKMAGLLKTNGTAAVFWHTQDVPEDSEQAKLFSLNSHYFDQYPRMNPPEYSGEFLEAMQRVLQQGALFNQIEMTEYPQTRIYEVDAFIDLYHSWSKYAVLSDELKLMVDAELTTYIKSLIDKPKIHYRTCCILAIK